MMRLTWPWKRGRPKLRPVAGYLMSPGPGAALYMSREPVTFVDEGKVRVDQVMYVGHDRIVVDGHYGDVKLRAEGWWSNLTNHVGRYGEDPAHDPRNVIGTAEERIYYHDLLVEAASHIERRQGIRIQ